MSDTTAPTDDAIAAAKAGGLRYVTDSKPGLTRKRHGKNFRFFDQHGKAINDEDIIARIKAIGIPPAYDRVWICPTANGHIQATGYDARGRKQYRYHARWREVRDQAKFQHILSFGGKLPAIRKQVSADLRRHDLPRERVLAAVVDLLEHTLIRVGNAEYARTNESYGLTTLKDEHVDVRGTTMKFRFTGKSGKSWDLKYSDRRIAKIVKSCAEIEGQELFKWVDADGNAHDVESNHVNNYLRDISGEDFTAKDFRTWAATMLAAGHFGDLTPAETASEARKSLIAVVDQVAERLGNTRAICRKCYIHPAVMDAWLEDGLVGLGALKLTAAQKKGHAGLTDEEIRLLLFLQKRLAPAARKAA